MVSKRAYTQFKSSFKKWLKLNNKNFIHVKSIVINWLTLFSIFNVEIKIQISSQATTEFIKTKTI